MSHMVTTRTLYIHHRAASEGHALQCVVDQLPFMVTLSLTLCTLNIDIVCVVVSMHALYSPCTRRMGLHQRHIGMTGTMNILALYSLTQYIGLCPILFQCTKSNNFTVHVLVKCTDSLSYTCTHFCHFSSTSVCVWGGGDGKVALYVGYSRSCSPSKRKAQPM